MLQKCNKSLLLEIYNYSFGFINGQVTFFVQRYIEENPFHSTCDLEEFAVFMQTNGWLPYNSSSVFEPECASPGQYQGVHIIYVPYHNMSCNESIGKYMYIKGEGGVKCCKHALSYTCNYIKLVVKRTDKMKRRTKKTT